MTTTTRRPVPTRNQGRALPASWAHRDIAALADRLRALDLPDDQFGPWLAALADREVRNVNRYTRRLDDEALLADIRNTDVADRAGAVFAGRLDYSRNYRRAPRRMPWGDRDDA